MASAHVPTASARVVTSPDQLEQALDEFGAPYVVKEDGLAAGKGVVVTSDRDAALKHGLACLEREGGAVVVEDYLDGPEASVFCVCDGRTVRALSPLRTLSVLVTATPARTRVVWVRTRRCLGPRMTWGSR